MYLKMPSLISLSGQRFGRLLVQYEDGRDSYGGVLWRCVCDCGSTAVVSSRSLRAGFTHSCGCLFRETIKRPRPSDPQIQIEYGPGIIAIQLRPNLAVLVDEADAALIRPYHWCPRWNGESQTHYASANLNSNGKHTTIQMHRLIMSAPFGIQVDHRNGNGLDNRRTNIRLASTGQNQHNRKKHSQTASSRFKGVSLDTRMKKWQAYVNFQGERFSLGYFDNEIEAAIAYNARAAQLFNEFARLNQIKDGGQ